MDGSVNTFALLYGLPVGATVTTDYQFQDAAGCGAVDRSGVFEGGAWLATTTPNVGRPVFRLPVDEQAMVGGVGLAYTLTLAQGGQSRVLSGLLCYRAGWAELLHPEPKRGTAHRLYTGS